MGKKNQEVEPLFTPIKTTDDDDDDAADVELATDGGPAVSYHDDPSQASSPSRRRGMNKDNNDDNGPSVRYRDEPVDNIFDWGSGGGGGGGGSKKEKGKKNSSEKKKQQKGSNDRGDNDAGAGGNDSLYQIDDFDPDATGFSPVSLHDTDDEDSGDDDDEENGNGSNSNGNNSKDDRIRLKANNLLKQRVFDDTTYNDDDDDDDDRIFVGGGWGRHGSQFSCCPHGFCACCCRGNKPPAYSRGPPQKKSKMKKSYSLCGAVCCGIAFLMLVTGSGYLGYEAGLPVEDVVAAVDAENLDGSNETTSATTTTNDNTIQTHTKGEEWLEWLEREKDDIHMPHFNFTSSFHHKKKHNNKDNPSFKKPQFEPKTQIDLLHISETIFQSCSERSLKTTQGRTACLSLCHGHYCCFEKDVEMGSCVSELNSYCFAYAACENVISDFGMDNANKPPLVDIRPVGQGHNSHDGMLNALDVKLLGDTCSVENIATIDGIRDCTAFCQHHLCCFNRLEEENCSSEFEGECQAYDACRILVEGPMGDDNDDTVDGTTSGQGGGESGGGGALAPKKNNNGGTAVVQPQQHSFKSDCMDNNLMENWDICKAHCSKFECCFRGTDSCYAENAVECDEYYICEEFFFDEDEDQDALVAENKGNGVEQQIMAMGNNNNNNNSNDVPSLDKDIETAVNAVCGLGLKTPGDDSWVTSCHTLCANYLCCFATYGTQSNCRDSYGDNVCNAYQGCAVLHTVSSASTSPAPNSNNGGATAIENGNSNLGDWSKTPEERQQEVKAVNEACVPKASRDPWLAEKCRKACDARKCCYADAPGNCSAMNEDWCSEFVNCDVLY